METFIYSWFGRIDTVTISILPKQIYQFFTVWSTRDSIQRFKPKRFNTIPTKIPWHFQRNSKSNPKILRTTEFLEELKQPWKEEQFGMCHTNWFQTISKRYKSQKEMATHYSILAGKSHGQKRLGGLQSTELQRVGYDLVTKQQYYYWHRSMKQNWELRNKPILIQPTNFWEEWQRYTKRKV